MSLTGFLSYNRVNWQQSPSKSTPLSAANLNTMDAGIKNNNDMISNIRDEVTQLNSNIDNIYSEITTNLLKSTLKTTVINGVTCTNNGDGTYTLNGTASAESSLQITEIIRNVYGGMKLLGTPSAIYPEHKKRVTVTYYDENFEWANFGVDNGNGLIINSDYPYLNIAIYVVNGETCNNLVFKPMLTTNLNATYDDFVPYTGSTGSINGDMAELNSNLSNKIKSVNSIEFTLTINNTGTNILDLTSIIDTSEIADYTNIISIDIVSFSGNNDNNAHIFLPYENFKCFVSGNPSTTTSSVKIRVIYFT